MPAKKNTIKRIRTTPRKPDKRHPLYHLRRAYEFQGRIEILEGALAGTPFCEVTALTALAELELAAGRSQCAAELLRAAEHLTFAALAPYAAGSPSRISSELKAALTDEFNNIAGSAELLWSESTATAETTSTPLFPIYSGALAEARRCLARGAWRPALELARAAESLAKTAHQLAATSTHAHHRLAS